MTKGPFLLRRVGMARCAVRAACSGAILAAFALTMFFALGARAAVAASNSPTVILVVGAPGEEEFGTNFAHQVELWTNLCQHAVAKTVLIGLDDAPALEDHERLKQTITAEAVPGPNELWIILIGHGTFDGKEGRFNLRGPDLTATEMADWLKPVKRPVIFINTASASAPFLNKLSASNRVVITATRSGSELNYARFGQYLAQAMASPDSDLDKDGQISLLESFLIASGKVAEFYKTEGRLLTEHALLDDNGDGLGTPPDWFRGVRAVKKPQKAGTLDGARANQIHLVLSAEEQALSPEIRAKRDTLEMAVIRMREAKTQYKENEYYTEMEKLLLELAKLTVSGESVTNIPAPSAAAPTSPSAAK